jgi:hypothetical protein
MKKSENERVLECLIDRFQCCEKLIDNNKESLSEYKEDLKKDQNSDREVFVGLDYIGCINDAIKIMARQHMKLVVIALIERQLKIEEAPESVKETVEEIIQKKEEVKRLYKEAEAERDALVGEVVFNL